MQPRQPAARACVLRILATVARSSSAPAFFCSRRSMPARMPRPYSSAASCVCWYSGFRSRLVSSRAYTGIPLRSLYRTQVAGHAALNRQQSVCLVLLLLVDVLLPMHGHPASRSDRHTTHAELHMSHMRITQDYKLCIHMLECTEIPFEQQVLVLRADAT